MFSLFKRNERYSWNNFLKTIIVIIVFLVAPGITNAATLSISPASGSYSVGQTFPVSFYTASSNQSLNAVSGTFNYSSSNLEIVSVSKNGSIFSLWVQEPSYSNATGVGSFEGIVLNPGFIGNSGKLVTYTFRVKAAGTGTIRMGSSSILANDGNGTNIFSGSSPASFNLIAAPEKPIVAPETKPSETPTEVKPIETPVQSGILEIKEIPREDATVSTVQFKISVKNTREVFKKYLMRIDQGDSFIWEDILGKGIYTAPLLSPGDHTLLVKTIDSPAEINGYIDFTIGALPLPTILKYTAVNHISQQPVVVYGTADSGNHIVINFTQGNEKAYSEDIQVDQQGRFLFIIDKKLPPGAYTMSLSVYNDTGASSEHTIPVTIKVKRYPYLDLGIIVITLPILLIIFTVLLVTAIVLAVIYYLKFQATKVKSRRKKIVTLVKDSFMDQ